MINNQLGLDNPLYSLTIEASFLAGSARRLLEEGHNMARRVVAAVAKLGIPLCVLVAISLWVVTRTHEQAAQLAIELPWPQFVLRGIVQRGQLEYVRYRALERIDDEIRLFDIAADSRIPSEFRIDAIGRLSVQAHAVKIAKRNARTEVRLAAGGKLNRETVSSVIAEIADQAFLASVATSGYLNDDARRAALSKIADKRIVERVATEDVSLGARKAAIALLTDQKLVAHIAMEDRSQETREAAIAVLTDQERLTKIAQEESSWELRRAATRRLNGEPVLKDIARYDPSEKVRIVAAQRLAGIESPGKLTGRIASRSVAYSEVGPAVLLNETSLDTDGSAQTWITLLKLDRGTCSYKVSAGSLAAIRRLRIGIPPVTPRFLAMLLLVKCLAENYDLRIPQTSEGLKKLVMWAEELDFTPVARSYIANFRDGLPYQAVLRQIKNQAVTWPCGGGGPKEFGFRQYPLFDSIKLKLFDLRRIPGDVGH